MARIRWLEGMKKKCLFNSYLVSKKEHIVSMYCNIIRDTYTRIFLDYLSLRALFDVLVELGIKLINLQLHIAHLTEVPTQCQTVKDPHGCTSDRRQISLRL